MRAKSLAVLLAAFLLSFIGGSALAVDPPWGHWPDKEPNYPRGYAFIEDQTPAAWPVYTAAVAWDQAPKLDLVWESGSNTCGHCVPFTASAMGAAGCTGTVGETYNRSLSGVHITSASVRVDSGCTTATYNARLEIACHEMGHAIGLMDRDPGASSCMRTGTGAGGQTAGSAPDFTLLAQQYGHDS